jgi:hypothetical protein
MAGSGMNTEYDNCPHCGADLFGDVIPEHIQPGGHRYQHSLGIEIRGVYDGVLFYACPYCYGTWHRWKPEHSLREAAETHRARFTETMRAIKRC